MVKVVEDRDLPTIPFDHSGVNERLLVQHQLVDVHSAEAPGGDEKKRH